VTLALRCTEGALQGQQIEIDRELAIGREMSGAASLGGDTELSRRHARVYVEGSQLLIEDLGSTNGTFVNDQRLTAARSLRDGDRLRCGKTRLEVIRKEAGEPTQPAMPTRAAESPRSSEDAPHLEILAGALEGQSIPLSEQLAFGRAFDEPWALGGDRRLSRRHARVARSAAGTYYIEDTGSTNGTTLNGQQLRGPQALRDGDQIGVGSTRMVAHGLPLAAPVIDPDFDRNSPGFDEPVTVARVRPRQGAPAPSPFTDPSPAPAPGSPPAGDSGALYRPHTFEPPPAFKPAPGFAGAGAGTAQPPLDAAPVPGQLFVPRGAAGARLGSRRLIMVFASVLLVSMLIGLAAVLLAAPPDSRACPNGFVCQKPSRAPALISQTTFRGALGWRVEYDPARLAPASSSVAGNQLLLYESRRQDSVFGLPAGFHIIGVEVRAYPAAKVSARAAMQSMASRLTGNLVGAAQAPSADQIFAEPTLGFHPGVGEVLEGNLRTPQGPGRLLKVTSVAATSGTVTVVAGVIYDVLQGRGRRNDPDRPLDQLGDSVFGTIRFPSDGAA
jgi:pSer/pThr/pTyr-binding forkhead associated (FHA) protein